MLRVPGSRVLSGMRRGWEGSQFSWGADLGAPRGSQCAPLREVWNQEQRRWQLGREGDDRSPTESYFGVLELFGVRRCNSRGEVRTHLPVSPPLHPFSCPPSAERSTFAAPEPTAAFVPRRTAWGPRPGQRGAPAPRLAPAAPRGKLLGPPRVPPGGET